MSDDRVAPEQPKPPQQLPAPSKTFDPGAASTQRAPVTSDEIDEQSDESFPASDPPSYSRVTI